MKRALVVLAAALSLSGDVRAQTRGEVWSCGVDEIFDVRTLCRLAPEPGMRLYVTDVIAQSTTATGDLFSLWYAKSVATGGTANCGSSDEAQILPPSVSPWFAASNNATAPAHLRFNPALIVPTGKDFCLQGGTNESITIQVLGYVAP